MGEHTAIKWTDATFNPWWGCARVSDGCQHCYAETFAKRTGHDIWGKTGERRLFGDKHWNEPVKWNAAAERAGRPTLVFCASMADVFENHAAVIESRERLWDLIAATPHLIWQLLTKRPENVRRMVPVDWTGQRGDVVTGPIRWPSNCWIGTTVEHQRAADERIPILLDIPAPVRFLSCEPLLGSVDLTRSGVPSAGCPGRDPRHAIPNWVIVGGESGPGHRPMNMADARRLIHQCEAAGIPVFFKQVGGKTPTAGGDLIDGRRIQQFPPQAQRGPQTVRVGVRGLS